MLKPQSSLSLCSRSRNVLLAAVAGAALSWPEIGAADSAGPFAKFLGSWRGSGQVTSTNGAAERISCRATYTGSENGAGLSQTLVCASDSYRFDVRGYVVAEGQSVQGHRQEMSSNVAGRVLGRISDAHAALAKAFCTAKCRETVAWARELIGGNGIVADYKAARFFTDCEALYSYEGTYQMQNLIVGKAITGIGAFV